MFPYFLFDWLGVEKDWVVMKPDEIEALRLRFSLVKTRWSGTVTGRLQTTGNNMGVTNVNTSTTSNQPLAYTQQNGELRQHLFFQCLYYLSNDFKISDFNEYDLR
jgi:hypothetical protein